MRIDAVREGDSATLHLEGCLDREWAEHLAATLDELLQQGVRSLHLDFTEVTYASTAAAEVLTHVHQELQLLRGEVRLSALSATVREAFDVAGWDPTFTLPELTGHGSLRRSSWHARTDFARSGTYEVAAVDAGAMLECRVYGDPADLSREPVQPSACSSVDFGEDTIGIGVGAIGASFEECRSRFGEVVGVSGCLAHFPSGGARKPDYLIASGPRPARAIVAAGLTCRGGFSQLVRFNAKPEAEAVPLSELAAVCLRAAGGSVAAVVIAGESAGLTGARLTRSPGAADGPLRFELPALREWLSFAPEPMHPMTTTLIVGIVARGPDPALAPHLRPFGELGELAGHFHALVFAYRPLPHRTVALRTLVEGLFTDHRLRDVLHLISDDRRERGVPESACVRGVAWVGPIARILT